jgi:hypothetical protein
MPSAAEDLFCSVRRPSLTLARSRTESRAGRRSGDLTGGCAPVQATSPSRRRRAHRLCGQSRRPGREPLTSRASGGHRLRLSQPLLPPHLRLPRGPRPGDSSSEGRAVCTRSSSDDDTGPPRLVTTAPRGRDPAAEGRGFVRDRRHTSSGRKNALKLLYDDREVAAVRSAAETAPSGPARRRRPHGRLLRRVTPAPELDHRSSCTRGCTRQGREPPFPGRPLCPAPSGALGRIQTCNLLIRSQVRGVRRRPPENVSAGQRVARVRQSPSPSDLVAVRWLYRASLTRAQDQSAAGPAAATGHAASAGARAGHCRGGTAEPVVRRHA